jgi:hypothetical protein
MSLLRFTLVISTIVLSLLTGCSSDNNNDTGTNPTPTTSYFMKATADGSAFTATEATCIAVRNAGLVGISAGQVIVPPRQISITLFSPEAGATYVLGSLGSLNSAVLVVGTTANDVYTVTPLSSSGGTVTVTKLDATAIEGTFSFTATNPEGEGKQVTNGSFRCKF